MTLAKASAQFRQSDVTSWAIVALVCGAIAVMGANVSAMIPSSVLGGLHKTRIEGASLDQLRLQVAELREQTTALQRENTVLTTRFALAEQQGNAVQQRVGSLEVSLPRLLELQPSSPAVDSAAVTASIGDAQMFDAEGGSVTVRRQPMSGATSPANQPLPDIVGAGAPAAPNDTAFGMALGTAVPAEQALGAWNDLSLKLGPLLFGLSPLLTDAPEGSDKRIVVGPIANLSEVTALCGRLERISIACLPVPFTGTPLRQ